MLPKRKKKKQQNTTTSTAYLDVKQEYLDNNAPSIPLPPHDGDSSSSSSDDAGSEVRLRASEKRDILLYYILENFYTIDEAHKNTLYAFLLKLSESKAIDFDPFVQPGLYSHFRKQLDHVMHDIRSKASVPPLLQGIHSSNYNNNMMSRAAIDFESVCFLGKGGFGEVIKARNRIDGVMYALKKVRFRDLPNSAKNLDKVLREVKALAQLDHENVLRYYNAWIEVEHAGDYTKKMLEAVSHRPQLPAPSPPPSPPRPQRPPAHLPHSSHLPHPTLSVEVSSENIARKITEAESEEETAEESETSGEGTPFVGAVYGCATTTTDEEEEGEAESESGEESGGESGSEEESEGVEFETIESSQSSSHAMMHGINKVMMNEKTRRESGRKRDEEIEREIEEVKSRIEETKSRESSSDSHNIHSIHSSSASSSSHGNAHGINTAEIIQEILKTNEKITKTNEEIATLNSNTEKIIKTKQKIVDNSESMGKKEAKRRVRRGTVLGELSRLSIRPSKNSNEISPPISSLPFHPPSSFPHPPSSFPPPPPLRLSSELVYAKGRLTRSKSGEMRAKNGPKIRTGKEGPIIRSASTSANSNYENSNSYSRSYSNSNSESAEFGKGETGDESDEWESGGTSASKNFSNEVSPDNRDQQQLLVVPFKGGAPQSPPPPPPKNRYVLYIQMQLCESKTLKSFLERSDRLVSLVETMTMFQQIVSGLHHIHSRGLIHRDLKPENIFFTTNGSIKIGDFGLSKQFHGKVPGEHKLFEAEVSPHTMGIGTRSYASPEQIRSNFYSAKSDIYSLGIILFEMFTVFETHTERAKVLQELRQGIIPPAMWSKFPDVARFVLCLMDEVPENRPSPGDILRSSFMTLAQGPCSVTSLVVKQQEEIEKLQEKIRKLELELSGNIA